MSKTTQPRGPSILSLHTRAAVLAAGVGAVLVLGIGVVFALGSSKSSTQDASAATASGISQAVGKQADLQKKAADKKAARKKAMADVRKRAVAERSADRGKRQSASWIRPVDRYVKGSTFGLGGSRWAHRHSGQDLVVGTGTPVKAVHQGVVVQAAWGGAYGNNIVIKHGSRTYTQYAHLSQLGVRAGQLVRTGQEIGKSGSTGNSTGPHLHFETRTTPFYGSGVDPVAFMRMRGAPL